MKHNNLFELSPVHYNAAAVKSLFFRIAPHSRCFRLHWHDRVELLRVKTGRLLVECNNSTALLSAGKLMLIPPKALHKGYTTDSAVEYDVLMFDVRSFYNETELCRSLLPALFDGRAIFRQVTKNADIIACFDLIHSSNETSLATIANTYHLLNLFYRNELINLQNEPKNLFAQEMIAFFENHAAEDISISSLCETFGYTPAHLCRKFKQATGLPPMTYLKIYRLELAYKKIKNREGSISTIAANCGFSDANYFTRCFKAHFGASPLKYCKERPED